MEGFRVSSKACSFYGVDGGEYFNRLNCGFEADPSDCRGSALLPEPVTMESCNRYVFPVMDGSFEAQGPAVATLIGRNTNDPPLKMIEKVFAGDSEAGALQRTLRVVDEVLVRPLLEDKLLPRKNVELRYFPPRMTEGKTGCRNGGAYQIRVKKDWSQESTAVRLSVEKSNLGLDVAEWQVVAQRIPEPDRRIKKRKACDLSSTSNSGGCNPTRCQLL